MPICGVLGVSIVLAMEGWSLVLVAVLRMHVLRRVLRQRILGGQSQSWLPNGAVLHGVVWLQTHLHRHCVACTATTVQNGADGAVIVTITSASTSKFPVCCPFLPDFAAVAPQRAHTDIHHIHTQEAPELWSG
jgi:hypothetical protein